MKPNKYEIYLGANENWFVKMNKKIIAGFARKEDAELFVKAKQANV